eukprot:7317890-Lingulodinium_polyedra.AAC.1
MNSSLRSSTGRAPLPSFCRFCSTRTMPCTSILATVSGSWAQRHEPATCRAGWPLLGCPRRVPDGRWSSSSAG